MHGSKDLKYREITEKILSCFYNVYNELGYGFLEKVYENSLLYELKQNGLKCIKQKPIKAYYKSQVVGEYFADLVVENKIILELKAVESIKKEHEHQLVNYLRSTDMNIGLLLNFGKKPEFKRKIFTM
jgi:GxxExxY protein